METFTIKDEFIKLGQLLKAADLVYTGGEAKEVIAAGEVSVNGEIVTQRGKKITAGDTVSYRGREVRVVS